MVSSSRRSRRYLSDSEVLERFSQRFGQGHYLPPAEERRRFWKFAFIGSFVTGPFALAFPFITWFELVPLWYSLVVLGLNASFLFCLAFFFVVLHRKLEGSSLNQERKNSFVATWYFVGLGWEGFFTSLMLLLATAGALVRLPGGGWWVYSLLAYGLIGIGLWAGRMEIVRAMVEGPKAHPWFGAVQLFFSPLSLGVCAVLGGVLRIFVQVMGRKNFVLTTLVLVILAFGLMILFLGLTLVAWILAYLHYQKWRGVEELRL